MNSKISKTLLTAIPAALAGAAGAAMYVSYRRDLRAAKARVFRGSRMIDTPCGPIEYGDSAPTEIGTGTTVLVIHGAGGGFDQGLELAQPLIESGYRVIAPSRFGYLGTPLPEDASPMAQADAHARLLDALGIDKAALVAFSAGAPSAMQLCLRHPGRCRALVLGVPLAYCPRPDGAARAGAREEARGKAAGQKSTVKELLLNTMLSSDFAFWTLRKLARGAMIKTVLGTPPEDLRQAGAEEEARLTEFLAHIEPVSRRKNGLKNEEAVGRSLARYELERLQTPTLVIGVENCLYNTYAGARYTAEHIPGARFVGYPAGGHLVVGHSEEMWREIREFLAMAMKAERGEEEQLARSR